MNNLPIVYFESQADWEAWLEEHQLDDQGVRLKISKKGARRRSLTIQEALESALCYGWIDGQRDALDEEFYLQKYSPRRPKSTWSKINREKALELIAKGRMRPAGLRQVEQAQADGRWETAYDSQANMEVPEDLQSELDRRPAAQEFFSSLNRSNRYAILFRLQTAKKAETRAARMVKLIEMLERKEKIHP